MRIELAIDRAGFWWDGLGFSVHIFREKLHAAGDPAVSWQRPLPRSRTFNLGSLHGIMSRAA